MYEVKKSEDELSISISGGLTAAIVPSLKETILDALQQSFKFVIIDVSNSEVIDSKGLGLLIAIHNSLIKIGGKLTVVIGTADQRKLFHSMRLDRHFDVIDK